MFSGAATPNAPDTSKRPLTQQAVAGEQWGAENSTVPLLHYANDRGIGVRGQSTLTRALAC